MDLHYKQAAGVGGLVLAAIVVFVAGAIWLQGRSLATGTLYTIQFADIGNLKRGSSVRVSGVAVGSVERIDFRAVGDVAVRISLSEQSVEPRRDATAAIASVGLIGDVVLDYHPGDAEELLAEGAEIPGEMDTGLATLGEKLASKAGGLMDSLALIVGGRLADDLHKTLDAAQRMLATLADTTSGPMAALTGTLNTMESLGARIDSTLANPAFQSTLTNLDSATATLADMTRQLTAATAQLDTLLLNINRGQGTLGKLATDTTLYTGLVETQQSLKALIDTITAKPGKVNLKVELF